LQAIENLISNAIKFVAPGDTPRIRVWAEKQKDCVRLWFEDNGIGIDPAHQERVFQPFQRLHGVEAYPGTGIGLAIVRRSLERMGGQCGVISKPGAGSRFWIELPSAEDRTR
jgi:signal transduction histidine kinase